jgi:hypothetical protein
VVSGSSSRISLAYRSHSRRDQGVDLVSFLARVEARLLYERTARGRLTVVLRLFRRSDRIEHHLRIGWLCQRLCHFVALIALVWIVAAKFGQFQSDCMTCKLLICSREPTDARRD